MGWPTPQDYNEAVQNPRTAFSDLELCGGQPEQNQIGLPRPISGGFACVYKIRCGLNLWAARCFLSEVPDQQIRYEAISRHLATASLSHTVPFTYLPNGINVTGKGYPLLKMQWIQGEPLNTFIGRHLQHPKTLLSLANAWQCMLSELSAAKIAHGDLQHGNVIVVGDQLRLLDYDGMYVPSLAGMISNEVGHRNYQLPGRARDNYGTYLDRFSGWVIYLSLVALAVHPELWTRYRGGDECLILRKEDYLDPLGSSVLRDLTSSHVPELRALADQFKGICGLSPDNVPAIGGVLRSTKPANVHAIGQGKEQRWWSDYVERSKPTAIVDQSDFGHERQATPVEPTWILESIHAASTSQPARIVGPINELRAISIVSLLVSCFGNFAGALSTGDFLVVTGAVAASNLALCYVRFSSQPWRRRLPIIREELDAVRRRIGESKKLIESISAERTQLQSKRKGAESDKALLQAQVQKAFDSDMFDAQISLKSEIELIAKRRQANAVLESQQMRDIAASIRPQLAAIDQQVAGIVRQEADAVAAAQRHHCETHIRSYLRRHLVAESLIPGVPDVFKSRVAASGFTTAYDISVFVKRVPGIGNVREQALLQWRHALEAEARSQMPPLAIQVKRDIESKFKLLQSSLGDSRRVLQAKCDSQIVAAKEHFESLRRSLDAEEQKCRLSFQNRCELIEKRRDLHALLHEQNLIVNRFRIAEEIDKLSKTMQDASNVDSSLRWQASKLEVDVEYLSRFSFSWFLLQAFHPGNRR